MKYYKQFAEMLGLELGQEFVLTDIDGNRKDKLTYKITKDGFLSKPQASVDWSVMPICTFTIENLLNGDVKAFPKPWKPEKGEPYWYYRINIRNAFSTTWCSDSLDLCRWKAGNCFKTREEADAKGKEIMEQIQKEYEEA